MLGFGPGTGYGLGKGIILRTCRGSGEPGHAVDMTVPAYMQLQDKVYVAQSIPQPPQYDRQEHRLIITSADAPLGLSYARRAGGLLFVRECSGIAEAAGMKPGRTILYFDGHPVRAEENILEASKQWRSRIQLLPEAAFPIALEVVTSDVVAPSDGMGEPADEEMTDGDDESEEEENRYWPWAGSEEIPRRRADPWNPPASPPRRRRAKPRKIHDPPGRLTRPRGGRGDFERMSPFLQGLGPPPAAAAGRARTALRSPRRIEGSPLPRSSRCR